MTKSGLIKRIPTAAFRTQKKNGKGVKTADDIISTIIRTNTIDSLMVFTNRGTMYRLLVDTIPEGTNTSVGTPISALVNLEAGEAPTTIYSMYRDTEAEYIVFVTKNGIIKKTPLSEYNSTKKKNGIVAINLRGGDEIIAAAVATNEDIMVVTEEAIAIRFKTTDVSATGRATAGVKALDLREGDSVIAALPVRDTNDSLALMVEKGLGKKVPLSDFPTQKRGGRGILCYKLTNVTGKLTAAALINDSDTILIGGTPTAICVSGVDFPVASRQAVGNQMIKNSKVLYISKI
jgi:DNA gyrase subunit A